MNEVRMFYLHQYLLDYMLFSCMHQGILCELGIAFLHQLLLQPQVNLNLWHDLNNGSEIYAFQNDQSMNLISS